MARLNSIFKFTGKLGNVIAYRRGGKQFLRSRPESVRQTPATRRSAQWFGAASRKGALVRGAIMPDLDIVCDGNYVNMLNKRIVEAGRNNHAGLKGYRFNPYTGIGDILLLPPTFSKDGRLRIPAQRPDAPRNAVRVEVKLIGTRIDFLNRRVTGSDAAVLEIDLRKPFSGADLTIDVPGTGTLLVTVQVRTFFDDAVSQNRKYTAADIIAVVEDYSPVSILTKAHQHKQLPQLLEDMPFEAEYSVIEGFTVKRE